MQQMRGGSWRVFQRKGSRMYWMDIRVGGRRLRSSTEKTERREAESLARAKLAELQDHYPTGRTGIILSAAMEQFLEHCGRYRLARSTIRGYRGRIARFISWSGDEDVSTWTPQTARDKVAAYLDMRAGEVRSLDHDRVPIGTFFNYLRYKRWYDGANPADAKTHNLRRPRKPLQKPKRRTTPQEDIIIRGEGQKTQLWPILLLTRWCGLRRGEACVLRWSEVDFGVSEISIVGHEGGRKHPRQIRLRSWVMLQLRSVEPGWLPPGSDLPIWPHHPQKATNMFREFCEANQMRRITYNDLRASFVSDCYENGIKAEQESRVAGHSIVVAEKHYLEWLAKQSTVYMPNDPMDGHPSGSSDDTDADAGTAAVGAQ